MPRYNANLPSVGLATFMKSPVCEDLSAIDADVAVLGIPYDGGTGFRPGSRFGPRDIRDHSTRFSAWGSWKGGGGYWDINQQKQMLSGVSIVDCGDVDVAYYDIERNMRLITEAVGAILDREAMPVLLGGDHSVSFPIVRAFERFGPLDIVHIDAHLDFIDDVDGMKYASGSPLRRMRELGFVRQMTHLGIRDIRSRAGDYAEATRLGSRIVTREAIRDRGVRAIVDELPKMGNVYVTIDIDGLDPSIAPGTGSPTVDGLLYHEAIKLLQGVAREKGNIVGFDLVEVNPSVDTHGQTSLLASTLIVELLGAIFENKTGGRA
ncbi:agmatinase [Pikeienuella sp. HZG-20]|uniref:agmatinase n=1 Tax=Paludibacillus litoralis TaxID=3133267 RepID=UPI0030EF803C